MGVTSTINKVKEAGNGVKEAYTFDFPAFLSTDLKVYKIDTTTLVATLQTLTTDYSVSLNAITEGGTVTYVTAPTSSENSFIKRELTFTQETDVDTEDGLPSSALNNEYDRSRMIDIQLKEESDRTLKFAETSDLTGITVPESTSAAARASKVIVYDSAGTGLELVSTTTITNTDPLIVKGDLVQYGTSAVEKLGIGSNDDTLQVASGKAAWTSQPTIADMTNATHDHADAAGGGNALDTPAITDFTNAGHTHLTTAQGGTLSGVNPFLTSSTSQASTSGTAIDFTGIPTGTQKITVMFDQVSTDGTEEILIQLGDAGGIETSAYSSTSKDGTATDSNTSGFILTVSNAIADSVHGSVILTLLDSSTFLWVSHGSLRPAATKVIVSAGKKALSAELTQLRITTTGTPDDFDAGSINIQYE